MYLFCVTYFQCMQHNVSSIITINVVLNLQIVFNLLKYTLRTIQFIFRVLTFKITTSKISLYTSNILHKFEGSNLEKEGKQQKRTKASSIGNEGLFSFIYAQKHTYVSRLSSVTPGIFIHFLAHLILSRRVSTNKSLSLQALLLIPFCT